MSEFVEVMKQRDRMCERNRKIAACEKCGLSEYNNGTGFGCMEILYKDPKKAEEIIMKWAEEHPVQTNYDKLVEVFGNIFNSSVQYDCCMLVCERAKSTGKSCSECKNRSFWEYEYKGVIENG